MTEESTSAEETVAENDLFYEIDQSDSFSVSIWSRLIKEQHDAASIIQPTWPDGTPWASETEASAWAEAMISYLQDPQNAEFKPGNGPSTPLEPNTKDVVFPEQPNENVE